MAFALLGGVAFPPLRSSPSPFAIALRHRDPQLAAKRSGAREDHGGSIMSDSLAGLPPRFLRTPEAARFLALSGRTLEKHRTYGTGPTYRKIGGRVVYAFNDRKAGAARGPKLPPPDPGKGPVFPAKRVIAVSPALATQSRR